MHKTHWPADAVMATDNPSDGKTAVGEVVSIELPAPAGWKKKFTPKKGATPGRNEVVFIAPDGEEIKNKTQLKLYLKSHSAGVTVKEFDWSTGDGPRRSARLSEKSKASESPDNDTPKKRQRKSSPKEVTKENDDASEDEATSEGTKAATEVSNADAQDTVEHDNRDVVTEKALPEKDGGKDPVESGAVGESAAEEEKAAGEEQEADPKEQKADAKEQEAAAKEQNADAKEQEVAAEEQKADAKEQEVAAEEQRADAEEHKGADDKMDVQLGTNDNEANMDVYLGTNDNEANMDVYLGTNDNDNEAADMVKEDVQLQPNDGDTDMNKEGNQVSDSKQYNGEEGVENTSLPSAVSEEANKTESVPSGAEVVLNVTTSHEAADTDMFLDAVGDELCTEADAKAEESADKLELMDQPKYTSDPKVETADAFAAHKDTSSTKDEAENPNSVGKDTPMQEAGEENNDLPS